jgi:DNA (cytosine-5)-methyltransferase 1
MTTLGTKRRPIALDDDEHDRSLQRKKFARRGYLATKNHPIIGLDDSNSSETLRADSDEDIRGSLQAHPAATRLPARPSPATGPPPVATFSFNTGDYMDDTQLQAFLRQIRLNSGREIPRSPRRFAETILEQLNHGGKLYRPGKSVELRDGTFLRIVSIVEVGDKVLLRGSHFKKCSSMDGLAPPMTNELCWVVDISTDEAARGVTTMITETPLSEVKGFRIIRLTNYRYPEMSHKTVGLSTRPSEALLFCRLKHIKIWQAGRKQTVEEAIVSLTFAETDRGYGIEPKRLRENWRGVTIRGGSFEAPGQEQPVIDITSDRTSISTPSTVNRRQYTFGDGFCGAGGVSCGAKQAGLRVSWGFDKSEPAMNSYRRNNHDAMCETSDIADFLTNPPENIMVDIIHCSPPCQTFSPAKTVAGPNDDANEACIFSVRQVTERGKPRIFTMEETSGLQDRHKAFLNATIHTFVDLGYSVRWKLVDCAAYGVPQKRKRLVVMASGYGCLPYT